MDDTCGLWVAITNGDSEFQLSWCHIVYTDNKVPIVIGKCGLESSSLMQLSRLIFHYPSTFMMPGALEILKPRKLCK